MEIRGFFGPYRFLSNFHFVPVLFDGETYRTTEHAYQASKFFDHEYRRKIRNVSQPKDARRLGNEKGRFVPPIREDWETYRLEIMLDLTRQKFRHDPLKTWLLSTEDWYLEETNGWGDKFWGVCNGEGENNLGKILMRVRSEIQ